MKKNYTEFFTKHVNHIKKNSVKCMECGASLRGNTSEVAHILPKGYYKSIGDHDDNVVYLCGLYSENNCHDVFDSTSAENIKKMKIYPLLKERFKIIEEFITERIPYKIYDLFE